MKPCWCFQSAHDEEGSERGPGGRFTSLHVKISFILNPKDQNVLNVILLSSATKALDASKFN